MFSLNSSKQEQGRSGEHDGIESGSQYNTDISRRSFCKAAVGGLALGLGPGTSRALVGESLITSSAKNTGNIAPEKAFASSFVNVPQDYGPTRISFDRPLPTGLQGTLYRNGPARMQRGSTSYDHWFDGDGMVHAFTVSDNLLVHKARSVATKRSAAEEKSGRFLWSGFGTRMADSRSVQSPDDLNVANISVLPIENEVLALWEAGSPYRLHAETLETLGRHVFSTETDGLPFSAHPRIDPRGSIWNFGYLSGSGKLVLYELNAKGALLRTRVVDAPNADMVHDFAITEDYLVFVLQPLRFQAEGNPARSFLDNLQWDADSANEIIVIDKRNLGIIQQFQLPAFFAFHMGNAWQDGQTIRMEIATTPGFHPLMDEIIAATRGERYTGERISTQTAEITLDSVKKQAFIQALPTQGADFPRFDQRFTGQPTEQLFMLASGSNMPDDVFGFNTVTSFNRHSATEASFNYGADTLAEEHVFVAKPGGQEGEGWLLGTSYNWHTCKSSFSVFNAKRLEAGPIAQAHLPYGLPMGLHGQFVPT